VFVWRRWSRCVCRFHRWSIVHPCCSPVGIRVTCGP